MRRELNFAFLGPHSSYVANVTWSPSQPNRADEFSTIRHYGMPEHWVDKHLGSTNSRYITNICGNDGFAFLGHYVKGTKRIYTEKFGLMIKEIEALQSFALKAREKSRDPLFLRLGPASGSFFAISHTLKRYRWAKLPDDLEDAMQERCPNGYGNIHDVAINAAEGWVIQLKEGKDYVWAGALPEQLRNALSIGLKNKKKIKHLYLNHQNEDEYILIFEDGSAYISLHEEFREEMEELVEATFTSNLPSLLSKRKRAKPERNFVPSCACSLGEQAQQRAAYYNQRGRFHLRRGSPEQALSYMREAYRLNITNPICREDYFMARVAARKLEPGADDSLQEDGAFQIESEFQYNRARRTKELEARWQQMLRESQQQNLPNEWTYIRVPPQPINILGPIELHDGSGPFELESPTHSEVSIGRESVNGCDSFIASEYMIPKGIRYYG